MSGGQLAYDISSKMTELRQLRYFVTIADEGQMTRAAQKLHLAQPALSQAISQLEERLGVELFTRHPRGVTLTAAGEAYLSKASAVLAAIADAELTAQAMSRASSKRIEWGFIGSPPMVDAPELFSRFKQTHPDSEVSFRELSYPRVSTSNWLQEVDVALCYSPTPHPAVVIEPLRRERRTILMAAEHPLASKKALAVADVIDECFCGTHPALEPVRAGFWRLDDHRGGPPAAVSSDRVSNPQETLAAIASSRNVFAAPESNAANFLRAVPGMGVVSIPLHDAHPTILSLVAHNARPNAMADTLIFEARDLGAAAKL